MSAYLSQQDLRLCVDVVKAVARQRGVAKDAAAAAKIMGSVAHQFNKGMRTHEGLISAMKAEVN